MADLYSVNDAGIAYYRSKDPLRNFKLRVCIQRVTSNMLLTTTVNETEEKLSKRTSTNSNLKLDFEDRVFQWQEKVFSRREIEFYSEEINCSDILSKKYHENVCKLIEQHGEIPHNRLFTIVDHDKHFSPDENIQRMTTSPNEYLTPLAKQMINLRQRKISSKKKSMKLLQPKGNLIELEPSIENKIRKGFFSGPVQKMYIMADLSGKDCPSRDEDEHILCCIEVDHNGVISLHPDQNKGKTPYRIETAGLGRDVFEYAIEHVSNNISSHEQNQEMKLYHELYTRHNDFYKAIVGNDFDTVPDDVLRLMVYGEIESAKNFEYNDLYLHFFVDLPKGWSSVPGQELSWVTQTCSMKEIEGDYVAYYSFPFHFELLYKKELRKVNRNDDIPHFPNIYFEVLSLDSWQRYRTEGYSYLTVPATPGLHKMEIDCWRPCGNSILAELRRFFIGGSPELEDPTYTGIPSTFEGNHLSKFGFRTESTGIVNVSLNVLMQSKAFIDMKASSKTLGTIMENLGISSIQTGVMQVLAALKKAQTRMRLAREAAAVFQELRIKNA